MVTERLCRTRRTWVYKGTRPGRQNEDPGEQHIVDEIGKEQSGWVIEDGGSVGL